MSSHRVLLLSRVKSVGWQRFLSVALHGYTPMKFTKQSEIEIIIQKFRTTFNVLCYLYIYYGTRKT